MPDTIAIIGAGPGGLTLARILHVHGIAATILELDDGPASRGQGGSLDLHADSGLRALELAGLTAAFERAARYDDQDVYVYAASGALLYDEVGAGGGRPEIDRAELRRILLDSLPAGAIEWGRRVSSVEPVGSGARVHFADGASRDFALVVGADGTWSRVRPALTDARPAYTGVAFVELELTDFDARHPDLVPLVPHGKLLAIGGRKTIIAQRSSNSVMRVYVAQQIAEADARQLATRPASAIKQALLHEHSDWAPQLRAFIERADDRALVLPICALPIGHAWPQRRGITLLGDAAHVMSPFAGEGVNNAMRDAFELALAIAGGGIAAVARYEAAMFERIVETARESAAGLDIAMAEDAAPRMVALMRSHHPDPARR
ncbi:MAG TPA: NAD(P)/FAD-dependent oxidoreductase [Kofleriaceae bacterium]|jgi:2-polyprenyl-6-methoxyphenol hydroxylase-like FAD-dependent oxidoreductase|nr:NAD(P)/FAD-dependent oxidoreductase [Kofleriaceae bacterium]